MGLIQLNQIKKEDIDNLLDTILDMDKKKLVSAFFLNDLNEYINKINKINKLIFIETQKPDDLFEDFKKYNIDLLKKADYMSNIINDRIIKKKLMEKFRQIILPSIKQGRLLKLALEKPRGYPGDFGMMEGIYENNPWTQEGIGYLWDRLLLIDDYVISVRNRKNQMKKFLIDYINRKNGSINITNFGCGSAREVWEIFSSEKLNLNKKINFIFIDQDKDAIKYVENKFIELNFPFLECNYINKSLTDLLTNIDHYNKYIVDQDLIYSIGVADYLGNEICKKFIKFFFNFLNKDGNLLIAFKMTRQYQSINSNWFCDWSFFERNEEDILKLINDSLEKKKFECHFLSHFDKRIRFINIQKL